MKDGTQPVIGVVDDDVSFREAIAGLVESFGFSAVTFASAHEFLASDRLSGLGCLILDAQMPGMNGLDLQSHLVQSGHDTPIIFVTSRSDNETRSRALKAGAIGFLGKPFDSEDLLARVRSGLAGRKRPARPDAGPATD